ERGSNRIVVFFGTLAATVGSAFGPCDTACTIGVDTEDVRITAALHVDFGLHDFRIAIRGRAGGQALAFPLGRPVVAEVAGGNGIALFRVIGLDAQDTAAQVGRIGRAHGGRFVVARRDVQVTVVIETQRSTRVPTTGGCG